MNGSRRVAAVLLFALLALQWLWHAWLAPPARAPAWIVALLCSLLLLPPAIAFLRRRRSAALWSGIVALAYFCHGIAEFQAVPATRVLALAETALATALVLASSWPGLRSRLGRRRAPAPPNV